MSVIIFQKPVAGTSEQTLARFLTRARRAVGVRGRVTVLVTGNGELRDLNLRFRGKNKPTDVLSFPAAPGGEKNFAGDIAISCDLAVAVAARLGHPVGSELKILLLHGLLHLAGFDHETDNGKMARREARLRRDLRLPDALIRRTQASSARRARPARRLP